MAVESYVSLLFILGRWSHLWIASSRVVVTPDNLHFFTDLAVVSQSGLGGLC